MRVLVAGGTGFLGRRLCAALERQGDQVALLSRGPARAAGIETLVWDPRRADGEWVERLSSIDAVINLAGENVGGHGRLPVRWTSAFKDELRRSRLRATDAIVRALAATPEAHRPKILVNASAVGYYGDRGDEVLTEASAPGSDFFADLCTDWEAAARAAEPLGVRVVRLRTGVVLDRGAMAADLLMLASRLGAGGPLGSGRQWWSWVHRDDWIGLATHALHTETLSGPLNVVGPAPRRMRDFPAVLGHLLHRPSVLPAPAFALRIALGEIADALLLASQRAVPERASETGYEFTHPTLEAALNAVVT